MRIGIDLGGTKIEIAALDDSGNEILRRRVPTPHTGYGDTLAAIHNLVESAEKELGGHGSIGIATPGALSPKTGLIKNANSTNLIGHPLDTDLSAMLHRPTRVANDAKCFALSESVDGAAKGMDVVFGIIAGTGVGGAVCVGGRVLTGAHAIGGEWGHNPLPAPQGDEEINNAPLCYCGKHGCIESWCSGPGLARDFRNHTGRDLASADIAKAAASGDKAAIEAMQRFYDRFARAIASVVNILDPDVIVIGGGLSNIDALYTELPPRVEHYAFTPEEPTRIVKNVHGDSSGVRGAAWLWHIDEVKNGLPA